VFVTAHLAVERRDFQGFAGALDGVSEEPALGRAVVSALGWSSRERAEPFLRPLLARGKRAALVRRWLAHLGLAPPMAATFEVMLMEPRRQGAWAGHEWTVSGEGWGEYLRQSLDSNTPLDQLAHRGSLLDLPGFAVDGDLHASVLVGVAIAAEIERPRPALILFDGVGSLSRRAAIGAALVVACAGRLVRITADGEEAARDDEVVLGAAHPEVAGAVLLDVRRAGVYGQAATAIPSSARYVRTTESASTGRMARSPSGR